MTGCKMSHSTLIPLLLVSVWINCHYQLAGGEGFPKETDNITAPDLANFTNSASEESSKIKLKLLVALPLDQRTVYDDPKILKWDRGLEMLPGAQVAVETID